MKQYLAVLTLLLSIIVDSHAQQSKMSPVDSLRLKISQLEKTNRRVNDSLQRELLFYRVKEDYFAEALSDQGTRFSLIVGSLLALAGFVGWGFLTNRIRDIKQQLDQHEEQTNVHLQSLLTLADATRYRFSRKMYFYNGLHGLTNRGDKLVMSVYAIIAGLEHGWNAYELCPKEDDKANLLGAVGVNLTLLFVDIQELIQRQQNNDYKRQDATLAKAVRNDVFYRIDWIISKVEDKGMREKALDIREALKKYYDIIDRN